MGILSYVKLRVSTLSNNSIEDELYIELRIGILSIPNCEWVY